MNKNKTISHLVVGSFFAFLITPMLAFAQTGLFDVLDTISALLNTVVPILITLAVIYFIWGVIKYVTAKDDEAQKEARKTIVSGIIGIFVIVSIWGLVALLANTFGIYPGTAPSVDVPTNPL